MAGYLVCSGWCNSIHVYYDTFEAAQTAHWRARTRWEEGHSSGDEPPTLRGADYDDEWDGLTDEERDAANQ